MWVGWCRNHISAHSWWIPEFQKRGACHMTELFIPINHNYIILLRNIPESGGYRIAGVEGLVRKSACSNFCIPDRIHFYTAINQSIIYLKLKLAVIRMPAPIWPCWFVTIKRNGIQICCWAACQQIFSSLVPYVAPHFQEP